MKRPSRCRHQPQQSGILYNSQGRYAEAEPLHLQALELRKQLLGQNHPDVAQSLNNLAELYRSQERFSEAEPLYLKALMVSERVLGIGHASTIIFRNNLAFLRYQMTNTIPKQKAKPKHSTGFCSEHLTSNLNQPLKKTKSKRKRKRKD